MNPSVHSDRLNRTPSVQAQPDQAFTLTELLVVVGTLAVLALLLVPALAGTKTDSWRIQCQNNLKQLQVGFSQFAQDHNEMFPPAGYQSSGGVLAWDAYIHHYFGDTNSDDSWTYGTLMSGSSPTMETIELCPADRQPRIFWMYGPGGNLLFAPRTYAMNCTGVGPSGYGSTIQVDPQNGKYPLPDLNQPNRHGVGIYWTASSATPDWDAKGYKTSVVKDPGGTILLCEVASSMQMIGNIWPCTCFGPQTTDGTSLGWGNLSQIDTATANFTATQFTSGGYNQGRQLYQAHWNRFNYLFHDGHVEALRIEDTIGTASGSLLFKLTHPKGMWTVMSGD
jgi:prepilin-type processing-associated H-X9-DG protein